MAVGQQSAGADRLAIYVVGDGVDAGCVQVVELDPGRNILLAHEDGESQRSRDRLRLFPGHEFYPGHGPKV